MVKGIKFKKVESFFLIVVLFSFSVVFFKYFPFGGFSVIKNIAIKVQIAVEQEIKYRQYSKELKAKKINDFSNPVYSATKSVVIPVLLYHGVLEYPQDIEEISIDNFKDQMFVLKKAGYSTIDTKDYLRFMRGEIDLPSKSVLITFDDGRKDNLYNADPILKATGFKATTYIITATYKDDFITPYYLDRKELERMNTSGRWDIQSHGFESHFLIQIDSAGKKGHFMSNLKWLSDKNRQETLEEFRVRIKTDLVKAKTELENDFDIKVLTYSFPFGDYGNKSKNYEIKKNAIEISTRVYPIAFIQHSNSNEEGYFRVNYRSLENTLFKRFKVNPYFSGEELLDVLESLEPVEKTYQEDFLNSSNWLLAWGDLSVGNKQLKLRSISSTNSGALFFDKNYDWKNYSFSSKQIVNGSDFSLIARSIDGGNYVSCRFQQDRISIEVNEDGVIYEKVTTNPDFSFDLSVEQNVELRIMDQQIECLVDNEIIVFYDKINDKLSHGSVGYKVWNDNGPAELIVTEMKLQKTSLFEN